LGSPGRHLNIQITAITNDKEGRLGCGYQGDYRRGGADTKEIDQGRHHHNGQAKAGRSLHEAAYDEDEYDPDKSFCQIQSQVFTSTRMIGGLLAK
jgi:hypothetical protein